MDYSNVKKIHFLGIKGVGVAPLAIIAKQAGFIVSGCDVAETFITESSLHSVGITPLVGFEPSHIQDVDLVITTGAHGGFDNPEIKAAKEKNIPIITQGEAVGIFMTGAIFGKKLQGISVTGCHGKTTTTAMIATLFKVAGKDPSFIIGTGDIPSLGTSGAYGNGEYFIAEADEYATEPKYNKKPKFLWQYPQILVITNVEYDHPDVYKTMDDVVAAYTEFTKHVEEKGVLIANGDDLYTKKILEQYKGRKILFGTSMDNDFVLSNVVIENGKTTFSVLHSGEKDLYTVSVIGKHNALNALASIIAAKEAGVQNTDIQKGLLAFRGTKRRLEYKGVLPTGAILYDDYAHHPTEIASSLQALKDMYPNKHLVCIFQPHTYSRTKLLFDQFISSFKAADRVILTDIFASAREAMDPSISSEILAQGVKQYQSNVLYLSKLPDVVKYINDQKYQADTVVVTMGAGDVYQIADSILSK